MHEESISSRLLICLMIFSKKKSQFRSTTLLYLRYTRQCSHSVRDSPTMNHRSVFFCGAAPVCDPILSLSKWSTGWSLGGKWRREQLTRAQRVICNIISDSWWRNPCSRPANQPQQKPLLFHLAQTAWGVGEPRLVLVPDNSPESSCHRSSLTHTWNILTRKVVALFPSSSPEVWRNPERVWSVQFWKVCGAVRNGTHQPGTGGVERLCEGSLLLSGRTRL